MEIGRLQLRLRINFRIRRFRQKLHVVSMYTLHILCCIDCKKSGMNSRSSTAYKIPNPDVDFYCAKAL
jgi:hypothetical protein